jgi:hypothetical protein
VDPGADRDPRFSVALPRRLEELLSGLDRVLGVIRAANPGMKSAIAWSPTNLSTIPFRRSTTWAAAP